MKNPSAYLKHLVKDPINTNEDAAAKKSEIMPLLYTSYLIYSIYIEVLKCLPLHSLFQI